MKFLSVISLLSLFTFSAAAQTMHQAILGALNPEVTEKEGTATFQIQLVPAAQEVVAVQLDVSGITATAGEDFVPVTEALVFQPGEMVKYVDVAIVDDEKDEMPRESFHGVLDATSDNVTVPDPIKIVDIIDDEDIFDMKNVSVVEPDEDGDKFIQLTLTREYPSHEDIELDISAFDMSATDPNDYVTNWPTTIIEKDKLSVTLDVGIVGDKIPEKDEQFGVTVKGVNKEITMLNPAVRVTIIDNDEGKLAIRFYATSLHSGDGVVLRERYDSGLMPLTKVENGQGVFYKAGPVVPEYKFYVPDMHEFRSIPGPFSIVNFSGIEDGVENSSLHYSIDEKKMRCQLAAPVWMDCFFPKIHQLMHVEDIHPDDEQMPGFNFITSKFEKVDESTPEGLVLGRQYTETTMSIPDPMVNDSKEYLEIEIMLVPEDSL